MDVWQSSWPSWNRARCVALKGGSGAIFRAIRLPEIGIRVVLEHVGYPLGFSEAVLAGDREDGCTVGCAKTLNSLPLGSHEGREPFPHLSCVVV